jgi:hypothetical protein
LLVILFVPLISMLATVSLDSQACREAAEINDKAGDRDLSAEAMAIQSAAPQQTPQLLLGIGGVCAHPAREGNQSLAVVT